ncbi:MAG TPA: molybdopterin cofactor-binding domain-containing protein [Burkholderiales bacterium]|jgi:isoquinoline 1-oxidoreductase beta subunit|nr:molybdopterin cofactor-binding domain-containing protein [Burkholderiales bacterium]HSF21999.1 molybdopterin cofactor-binding domain-containing protein [Burkholderiales bacterium]
MLLETKISRRGFMKTAGALTFSFSFAGRVSEALASNGAAKFNAWVSIAADDKVTVVVPAAEMGQGVITSLPLILAEELDADWSKVTFEYAPPNPKIYGNYHRLFNGAMLDAGSLTVPGYWTPLRIGGAQARRVLLDSAAKHWNVPVGELRTEPSVVVHSGSGRRLSYGEIVKFASVPAELPQITEADLKKPSQFRLIGKDLPRVDVPSKVDGSAKYGIDVRLPGMVYASVLESPMEGAKPAKVNTDDVMKVKGVKQVLPMPFGVAVIGEAVQATRVGRRALKVEWDLSGATAASFDSQKAKAEYARHGKDPSAKALEWASKGDAPKALASAARVIRAEYSSEHCYHAQMEPMNCVARVSDDGKSAEVWTGTQSNFLATLAGAGVLKTSPGSIHVHQHLLGGGYGRRIAPDAIAQAIALANATKQTVKLMLTREDDLAAARPRPMTYHLLSAGLDSGGKIDGWYHRIVAENVDAIAAPPRFKATGGKDLIGWRGLEQPFYAFPNMLADGVREIRGMRVQPWRGIGAGYNKFASECFLDEIANATKQDPVALRLELTREHPRAQAVIRAAAEMAEWNRPRPKDRALGIAFSDYHDTLTAGVAEISVDRKSGRIRVHHYWVAADPGIVVQPNNSHAQLESAVVYGLSAALLEELTVQSGAIRESNFHQYRVLRMSDMPEIHTRLIATDNPPTGMGEVGVPSVAPAIGNALFRLTGARVRELPMSPGRIQAALKA